MSAGQASSFESRQALESLCETYWCPLYAYARRRVSNATDAQDLTQSFFAELLEKDVVAKATPDRGRFRAFLLTAFKNFLSRQWEKSQALKRGGGRIALSLDFDSAESGFNIEPEAGLTAEQFYDQQWAIALLGKVMGRLQQQFARAGKSELFSRLKGFVIGDHGGATYAQVAAELNMTEAAAKKAASRMRRDYRTLLRDEIGQTVSHPNEIDDEIRNLFATLEL